MTSLNQIVDAAIKAFYAGDVDVVGFNQMIDEGFLGAGYFFDADEPCCCEEHGTDPEVTGHWPGCGMVLKGGAQ